MACISLAAPPHRKAFVVALPADHVIVCPILVGRDRHLASLDRALAQLAAGEGQVIAIAGEVETYRALKR